ncbi:MAG TPA: SBBP repeat-containing protein, partial [Acidimicrobiales bacterium]|nr:SBBP repeat-containing protein [Acidimicrobiales bacterium]
MRRLAPEARRSGLRPERLRGAGRVRGLGIGRLWAPPIAVTGLLLLVLGGSGPVSGRAANVRHSVRATEAGSVRATEAGSDSAVAARAVERSTLSFVADEGSGFVARGPGYGIALAPDEVRVAGPTSPAPLRMRLVGARPDASGRGELPGPGRTNLLLGDDPAGWRTGLAAYGRVTYAGVWDGIDVVYHGRGPQLEQDFVVAPGADAAAISLSFADARGLRLDSNGDLVVALHGGEVRLGRPTLYQEADGGRRPVPGAFALHGDRVGFHVGRHDPTRPLVIDPVLLESSYLGGSANDAAYGVAVDDAGNVYVTGLSESPDFPTASPQQGALVEDAGVRTDAFVAKLDPEGTGFVYSTFLGGKARDTGHAIAVSPDGSAVVAGYTESSDFPLARPIQEDFGGGPSDAFVARISPEGAVLQYSTYVGGSGTDTARGVALSQSGDAYLVGSTTSGDFPVAGAPLRGTLTKPDDSDAYVTRVNAAGSEFVYSTYLGGDGEDHALAVGVDLVGNAYVAGDTRSPDFPTAKAFQPG